MRNFFYFSHKNGWHPQIRFANELQMCHRHSHRLRLFLIAIRWNVCFCVLAISVERKEQTTIFTTSGAFENNKFTSMISKRCYWLAVWGSSPLYRYSIFSDSLNCYRSWISLYWEIFYNILSIFRNCRFYIWMRMILFIIFIVHKYFDSFTNCLVSIKTQIKTIN